MRKIIPIILSLLLLCSCTSYGELYNTSEVIINAPVDNSVNGYRMNSASNPYSIENAEFIGNINSKVFHKPTCSFAVKMKEENKIAFQNRLDAVNKGYKPCSRCKP